MSNTRKFSQFVAGGSLEPGDTFVGLRNGVNTIFTAGSSGSGGAGASIEITQNGHNFTVGQAIRLNGANYQLAQADTAADAEAVGLVTIVQDADHFTVQQVGPVSGLTGLTPGDVYYLDPTFAGNLTLTEPSNSGQISKPMLIASTATTGYILNMRGMVVEAAPVSQTEQISNILALTITQASHALSQGNWVRLSGTSYIKAISTSQANAAVVGQVISVIDANTFVLQTAGFISGTFAGLTAGLQYFLSDSVAGAMTSTEPVTIGSVSKPVFIANTTTSGFILEQRGITVGSGGGSSGDSLTRTITQALHGLSVPELVRIDSTTGNYITALADSYVNSLVVGMVISVTDVNNFVLQTAGYIPNAPAVVGGLSKGLLYYLSTSLPGGMQNSEPVSDGEVSRPVFMPDAANSGYLLEQRSLLLPFGENGGGIGSGNLVQTAYITPFNLTGPLDTPVSVSITPTNASARVRVQFSGVFNNSVSAVIGLKRNGVTITESSIYVGANIGTNNNPVSFNYVDTPNSNSAVVYTLTILSNTLVVYAPSTTVGNPTLTLIAEQISSSGTSLPGNIIQTILNGNIDSNDPIPQSLVKITPSSITSRIKYTFTGHCQNLCLYRNGVQIIVGGQTIGCGQNGSISDAVVSFSYIDSPATISEVSYTVGPVIATQVRLGNSNGNGFSFSTFIAEEIGA